MAIIECTYSRLFTSVPWLVCDIQNAVEKYAAHIQIDFNSIRSMMEEISAANISSIDSESLLQFMHMEYSPDQKQAQENLNFVSYNSRMGRRNYN